MENSEGVDTIRDKEAKDAQKRHDAIYPLGVSQHSQLLSAGHLIVAGLSEGIKAKKRKSPKK